jgi:uncharacterized protein YcbK (DUF882 family)
MTILTVASPVSSFLAFLLILLALPGFASAESTDTGSATDARQLSLEHTHTGKSLTVTYYRNGQYQAQALAQLDEFLADFRTGEIAPMDPAVYDILYRLHRQVGSQSPFQIISAYRSPATNEMLRKPGSGVAQKSQHLLGKAMDVRLADVSSAQLYDIALSMQAGGVGFYRESDFIHVDTGRVRHW